MARWLVLPDNKFRWGVRPLGFGVSSGKGG